MLPSLPSLRRPGLLALVLALGAPVHGCAKDMEADTSYAKDTDFSQYQSYRWITDDMVLIQSGTGNEKVRNVENEKRIRSAVEHALEAKGLHAAEGDEAQLVIAFTVGTKERYKLQGGGSLAVDLVTQDSETITRGSLNLYFFDRDSQAQVWSASTKKDLEPGSDPEAVINAAVDVLMGEYPPG